MPLASAAAPMLSTSLNPLTSPLKPSSVAAVASAGRGLSPAAGARHAVSPAAATGVMVRRPQQTHADTLLSTVSAPASFSSSGGANKHLFNNSNNGADLSSSHNKSGALASEVVPDVQLCVNYKKVDITVNDAKKHLRVRPPRIKAAVSELSSSTCEVFEYPHLFSVDCGLDDVGVDHSVLFFVVTQNPECFAVLPTVDCEGTLRFETAPPAPGSVHLAGTTIMVTAWDALSLTGSSITQHADEARELEEGVPFCTPIKLALKLVSYLDHHNNSSSSNQSHHNHSTNASSVIVSPHQRRGQSPNAQSRSCAAVAASAVGASADGVRFPRLNPNLLRDPFVVLGSHLQERLVGATPCPITDTELVCLPFVRALFFGLPDAGGGLGPSAVVLGANAAEIAALSEGALRSEMEQMTLKAGAASVSSPANNAGNGGGGFDFAMNNSMANFDSDNAHLLATALERLGRFTLERGAAQGGDGTVVEIMEQLVSTRRKMMRAASEQQPDRSKLGVEALQLLMALNCLVAAEVAAGSMADAASTLENALQLSEEFAPIVDDADAAWIMLRACYVALVRGDGEGALRILRKPAVAECDTVFSDHLQLRISFHVLSAAARCSLARYGEAIRKLKQLIAAQVQIQREQKESAVAEAQFAGNSRGATDAATASSSPAAACLPLTPLRHMLVLACVRAGDMPQARQVLHAMAPSSQQKQKKKQGDQNGFVDEEHEDHDDEAGTGVIERSVTYLLMNMANLYTELPEKINKVLRSATDAAAPNIFRAPETVVRAVDVWQALSLDPHSMVPREFLAGQVGNSSSSGVVSATATASGAAVRKRGGAGAVVDLIHVKLRILDAAVYVATSASAVSGSVDRQRAAVETALQRLRRELTPHNRDVVGAAETLGWLHMCSAAALTPTGGAGAATADAAAAAVTRHAFKARALCDKTLSDLLAFGVDVNNQMPRVSQLMCHACGALVGHEGERRAAIPASLNTATQESLDETLMRFGDGTRALFTPLVDRAIAEINADMFQPALEKLHKALKIVDSGNAIFLLGPLFRPSAQLTADEQAERSRLSRGRVDGRAAQDFAVVLFAMAAIAEAEHRLFDAETLLLQVLAALELAGVEETISTAAVYRAMSQLLFEDGHFGDALAYVERSEKLLHTKFPVAEKLRGETKATQQFIEFQIRSAGYSLKRMPDTRFKFAVFV